MINLARTEHGRRPQGQNRLSGLLEVCLEHQPAASVACRFQLMRQLPSLHADRHAVEPSYCLLRDDLDGEPRAVAGVGDQDFRIRARTGPSMTRVSSIARMPVQGSRIVRLL